jgi:hypothetical protein
MNPKYITFEHVTHWHLQNRVAELLQKLQHLQLADCKRLTALLETHIESLETAERDCE